MAVKLDITADAAKAIAQFQKLEQSERALVATVGTLTKESEKSQTALLKEIELRKKANEAKKEAVTQSQRLSAENEKQAREIDRLNDKMMRAAKSQDSLLVRGVTAGAQAAAAYLSIGAAINIASEAMANQQRLAEKSLSAVERIARAQRSVMLNMPGASPGDVTAVDARIRAAASASKATDLAAFYESVASSSAATGGNLDAAIRGTQATVPFTRLAPADLPVISSAALEIGKAAGSDDYERSIGMLLQIGGVTRQPNTADFARTIPESLVAGAGTSTDKIAGMESAAELYATLSNATGDVTGRSTSTAVANLVVRMEKFFKAKGADPGTHAARIAMLQSDATLRSEFLGGLGGEVVYSVPIRQLLTPGSDIAKQFATNQEAIDFATAGAMYESTVGNVSGGTAEIRAAETAAIGRAIAEEGMATESRSRYAIASEQLAEGLEVANLSIIDYPAAMMARAQFEAGVAMGIDPNDQAAYLLEGRRHVTSKGGADATVSAEEAAVVKRLDAMIDLLREGRDRSTHFRDRD